MGDGHAERGAITLDTFGVHCRGLISDDDIDNITGGTAARLFALKPRA